MFSVPPAIQARLERLAQQWLPEHGHEPQLLLPPARTESARIPRLDARSWRVLVTLGSVAFLIVGWMWWQGRAQPVVPIADHLVTSTATPLPTVGGSEVVVHVVGAVRRPGLVHLAVGSRVAEALKAAGGATSTKAEGSVNLARILVDGEQIRLDASGAAAGGASDGKVSLNSASAQQFEELPGVGPVLAQRILDYRKEHGSFRSIDELDEVSGIGTALMSQLRAHVQM
ncbi:MAG: ComEA family DNA-binding protein [Actinomycetota bacterium]|nr:ComEA family DNA-binding protein [Actinomycetota bacterium]